VFECVIPPECSIGEGTRLWHHGLGAILHPDVKIGRNCNTYNYAALVGGHDGPAGPPIRIIVGDNVNIGNGAKLLCKSGLLSIGDGSGIGANAVMLSECSSPYDRGRCTRATASETQRWGKLQLPGHGSVKKRPEAYRWPAATLSLACRCVHSPLAPALEVMSRGPRPSLRSQLSALEKAPSASGHRDRVTLNPQCCPESGNTANGSEKVRLRGAGHSSAGDYATCFFERSFTRSV
jgi:hypothetical protein